MSGSLSAALHNLQSTLAAVRAQLWWAIRSAFNESPLLSFIAELPSFALQFWPWFRALISLSYRALFGYAYWCLLLGLLDAWRGLLKRERQIESNASEGAHHPCSLPSGVDTCAICRRWRIDTAFVPCGHATMCNECARMNFIATGSCKCCSVPIERLMRVQLP